MNPFLMSALASMAGSLFKGKGGGGGDSGGGMMGGIKDSIGQGPSHIGADGRYDFGGGQGGQNPMAQFHAMMAGQGEHQQQGGEDPMAQFHAMTNAGGPNMGQQMMNPWLAHMLNFGGGQGMGE